jgi:hypothetical protein
MLKLPLGGAADGRPHVSELLDPDALTGADIRVAEHCYGCTAGQGSSCGGALGLSRGAIGPRAGRIGAATGTFEFPHARLLVFAKAPVPGAAKTRLIPALGAEGAARLQAHLLDATLRRFSDARVAPIELHCAPDDKHPAFRRWRGATTGFG